jgi:AcrR family transcriptional regulator
MATYRTSRNRGTVDDQVSAAHHRLEAGSDAARHGRVTSATRRIGAETSKTRAALIDATERLMLDEGYAAVSSRRVASAAGVKPPLVHYYFPTMDDLFLAVFRRGADTNLERHARALASPQPLRALWELANEPAYTALTTEFMALGAHRPAIRTEIAAYVTRFRAEQRDSMAGVLAGYGIDPERYPPAALLLAITGMAHLLVLEGGLGVRDGHDETRALVERLLHSVEGEAPGGRARRSRRPRRAPVGARR